MTSIICNKSSFQNQSSFVRFIVCRRLCPIKSDALKTLTFLELLHKSGESGEKKERKSCFLSNSTFSGSKSCRGARNISVTKILASCHVTPFFITGISNAFLPMNSVYRSNFCFQHLLSSTLSFPQPLNSREHKVA